MADPTERLLGARTGKQETTVMSEGKRSIPVNTDLITVAIVLQETPYTVTTEQHLKASDFTRALYWGLLL